MFYVQDDWFKKKGQGGAWFKTQKCHSATRGGRPTKSDEFCKNAIEFFFDLLGQLTPLVLPTITTNDRSLLPTVLDVAWLEDSAPHRSLFGFGAGSVVDLRDYVHTYINAHYTILEVDALMSKESYVFIPYLVSCLPLCLIRGCNVCGTPRGRHMLPCSRPSSPPSPKSPPPSPSPHPASGCREISRALPILGFHHPSPSPPPDPRG